MSGVTLDELLSEVGIKPTQLEKVCSDEHLRKIAPSLESWRELRVHLGLSRADVEKIERDSRSESEKRQQILQLWQDRFAFKATYKVLVEGLLSIGNAKMAETVCRLVKQQSDVGGDLDTPISPPLTPSTPDPSSPQRGAIAKSRQNSPVIEKWLLPSWLLLKCIQTNLHSLKQEIEKSKEKCKVLKDEALTAFEGGLNRIKSFLRVEHPKHMESRDVMKCNPLRIMVVGLGGTGKSALVNRLFGLSQEENIAEEGSGYCAKATTEAVNCYYHELRNGVEAIIFDTPGFDNADISDHQKFTDMKLKTEGKVDLMLYCVSVESPGARIRQGDVQAIHLLTRVFGHSLWTTTIFVLTFANMACKRMQKDRYCELKQKIEDTLHTHLQHKAGIPTDIVTHIPVTTAGDTDPVIPHEQDNWAKRLLGLFHDKLNPNIIEKLLNAIVKGVIARAGSAGW